MEISRNVLALILILVIIVSGFGTWSLLSQDSPGTSMHGSYTQPNDGQVALTVNVAPRGNGVIALDIKPADEATHG